MIASDTMAQEELMSQYPGIGRIYSKGRSEDLSKVLKEYLDNPELVAETKRNNITLATERLNWDIEKKLFLKTINGLFDKNKINQHSL